MLTSGVKFCRICERIMNRRYDNYKDLCDKCSSETKSAYIKTNLGLLNIYIQEVDKAYFIYLRGDSSYRGLQYAHIQQAFDKNKELLYYLKRGCRVQLAK